MFPIRPEEGGKMNVFNRIVVVLLLVVLILVSAAAIVLPHPTFVTLQDLVYSLDSYTSNFQGWVLMAAALLVVIALCLVVLWMEFRRKTSKTVRVEKISGGEARVAIESVVQRVQYNLDQLPQVLSVKPRVTAKGRKMDLLLDVETTQDVNIPAKTEELAQLTRSVIQEQMGLKLGKVVVTVRHSAAPPLERRRVATPVPPVEISQPEALPAEPQPEPPSPSLAAGSEPGFHTPEDQG
jgi:uncharacterized membrane protein